MHGSGGTAAQQGWQNNMNNELAEKRFGYLVTKPDASQKVVELPRSTKEIPCGKCGRTMTVSERTVLAYCNSCSQGLGVKR